MNTYLRLRKNQHSNEGGFIILTVPIVLILFAFFVASITKDTKPNQFYTAVTTQQNLENLRTALANYAHQNYRVPCPSNPVLAKTDPKFGVETPVGANNKCANTRGIVPFKTLGLSEDLAKDAWGFYLTYKVSPDFTTQLSSANNAQFSKAGDGNGSTEKLIVAANGDENHLHQMCRTVNWTDTSANYKDSNGENQPKNRASNNTNENIFKARFCCASNTSGGNSVKFTALGQKTIAEQNQALVDAETARLSAEDPIKYPTPLDVSVSDVNIGKVLDLDAAIGNDGLGDGISDGIVSMSTVGLDEDIALWDEDQPYCDFDQSLADRNCWNDESMRENSINSSVARANNRIFRYNPAYDLADYPPTTENPNGGLGDGIGPATYRDRHDDANGNNIYDGIRDFESSGKYWRTATLFEITDDTRIVQKVDLAMSDVGSGNESEPVQTKLEIVDLDGNHIETVSLVLALPDDPENGVGQMSVSLDMFEGEGTQDGLFHEGVDVRTTDANGNLRMHELPASNAVDLFNTSKANLMAALTAAGLTLDDVKIKSVKLNSTHASLGFSSMAFGTNGVPSKTDLIIRDENGNPRVPERDNPAAYGSADGAPHTTTIHPSYEAAAYAVISHGSDGVGSYMVGTPNQISTTGPDNPREIANASKDNNDLEVYDVRQVSSRDPLENFDDIVMWDSQVTLYKALRNGTCMSSQAL